jgi:hypothetical protein
MTLRRLCFLSILAWALIGAPAASAKDCKLLPALKPVKSLRTVAEQLGGVELEVGSVRDQDERFGTGSIRLSPTGELDFHAERGMSAMYAYECPSAAEATFTGRLARASCELDADCHYRVLINGTSRAQIDEYEQWCRAEGSVNGPIGPVHLLVSIRAWSPTVLRGQASWDVQAPGESATRTYLKVARRRFSPSDEVLVQLVPGAKDRALHQAIQSRLLQPRSDSCPLVFGRPSGARAARAHRDLLRRRRPQGRRAAARARAAGDCGSPRGEALAG